MKRIIALLLLCASVATAHTIVVLWTLEEQHLAIEEIDGAVVTNQVPARVVFWFADKFGARFQSATTLPWDYSTSDLSNAVASGAARLAQDARVADWTPQEVKLP